LLSELILDGLDWQSEMLHRAWGCLCREPTRVIGSIDHFCVVGLSQRGRLLKALDVLEIPIATVELDQFVFF